MPSMPRTAAASCVSSSLPSATSNSRSTSVRSSSSTRLTLSELEPALRTRTRNDLVWPDPIHDFGRILAVVPRVLSGAQPLIDHLLADVRRLRAQRRHAVDDVYDQVITIEIVEHDHVEWRGRRAFLLVSAHAVVGVIGTPVRAAMNQPRIAVVSEDHRLVLGEDLIELRITQAVRVLGRRLKAHEVDHVDDSYGEMRQVTPDQARGRQRLPRPHGTPAGPDHGGNTAVRPCEPE